MYLFTRRTRLTAKHQLDGIEWAIAITEKVNQITALDVGVWTPVLSPGVGTLSFGCSVETLSDLENGEAKLMADPIYLDLAKQGAEVTNGELDDLTAQYLTGATPLPFNPSYVAVVSAQLANGKLQRGIAAGLEIAEKANQLGECPTAFLVGTTGNYGSVVWISAAETLAQLERSDQAVNGNPAFMALVDSSGECFTEGATQEIWRRIV